MAAVYSLCFYETASVPTASTVIGVVPTGFRWIVRDMTAWAPGQWYEAHLSLAVTSLSGGQLWTLSPPQISGGHSYQWQGREVLDEDQELLVLADRAGWRLRINGYQLTLP